MHLLPNSCSFLRDKIFVSNFVIFNLTLLNFIKLFILSILAPSNWYSELYPWFFITISLNPKIQQKMRHLALLILFITNFNDVLSFCQPGCICFDDGKDVRCDHANLTTFPYMLNPMLKKLSLVDAKLKLLDSASISVYQELEYLDLSNNEIEELPSDFLVGFLKLKEVKLQNNKIRLISDDLFKELPSLEVNLNFI